VNGFLSFYKDEKISCFFVGFFTQELRAAIFHYRIQISSYGSRRSKLFPLLPGLIKGLRSYFAGKAFVTGEAYGVKTKRPVIHIKKILQPGFISLLKPKGKITGNVYV